MSYARDLEFKAQSRVPGVSAEEAEKLATECVARVMVQHVASSSDLLTMLSSPQQMASLAQNKVKLIILDSVARLVSGVDDQRSVVSTLGAIASTLKRVASLNNAVVVVTNQSSLSNKSGSSAPNSESEFPFLGRTWAHYVNTRCWVSRPSPPPVPLPTQAEPCPPPTNSHSPERMFSIVKSPQCPMVSCPFTISDTSLA
eukprot:c4431_g1_i1.p1 GENE.c4431_g1_i1~~c4431_g1_i1.p1  ORF type:complete len:200 (-),score=51.10 c4431_g1_i1:98-697(-)